MTSNVSLRHVTVGAAHQFIASAMLAVCAGQPIESIYIPNEIQTNHYNSGSYHEQPATHEATQQVHHRDNAEADKTATIVKYDSESHADTYHYDFETSNGIRAEQSGAAGKGSRAQGGFSYTGDDGLTYTVTYSADENGFRPQGAHLPTPPPTPEAILRALEQNAKDEASGISDDGSYLGGKYEDHGSSGPPLQHGGNIHATISSGYDY